MQQNDRLARSAGARRVVVEPPSTHLDELTSHASPCDDARLQGASSLRFAAHSLWRGLDKSVGYAPK